MNLTEYLMNGQRALFKEDFTATTSKSVLVKELDAVSTLQIEQTENNEVVQTQFLTTNNRNINGDLVNQISYEQAQVALLKEDYFITTSKTVQVEEHSVVTLEIEQTENNEVVQTQLLTTNNQNNNCNLEIVQPIHLVPYEQSDEDFSADSDIFYCPSGDKSDISDFSYYEIIEIHEKKLTRCRKSNPNSWETL